MPMILATNIRFPNLGIVIKNLPTGIDVFGFRITFYGIIIAFGMLCGWLMAEWIAKKTGQNPEVYLDFALIAIVVSVICARIYYVIFAFDEFRENPIQILNLRSGGLAIYGGIIGAVITAVIFTKIKKYSFGLLLDTGCIGLVVGQMIGRWGNFFNREAFGKYTNGLFAMQLNLKDVAFDFQRSVSSLKVKYAGRQEAFDRIMEIRNKIVKVEGVKYIQVHPTFLYESVWNLCLLILLLLFTRHKKFNGEIMLLYLIGYGLGRVWMEGLRTDQLFLWGTPFAVSQLLSALIVIISVIVLIIKRYRAAKAHKI